MRLLLIQAGFGAGGAEKVMALLAAHRAARGDEVHAAALSMPAEGSYFPYPDAVALHPMQTAGAPARGAVQLHRMRHIRQVMDLVQPDLVVSFLTKVNVLTLSAALVRRCPVIISERNNPRTQRAHPAWQHAQSVLALRARTIVMLTEEGRRGLPPWLRRQAVVIANPCVPSAQRPAGPCRRLAAVGRLTYQKGFDLLLPAFARIRREWPQVRLTIYGEGPERPRLEAMVRQLGLQGAVFLPGVTRSPGEWLQQSDLLLVSSRYEGFCNVVAEATVCGLPVVSFDCDYGPRDLIRQNENGVLVPAGDVAALAAAASRIIGDPARQRAFRAAVQINRARLSPSRIFGQWDSIIDRGRGSRPARQVLP
ncbi:glycosyltransferase (plasmid) [Leisingera sp. S132]|uniref:glycosyltransferase n=1 Tax=Leisingera sp. S132 TaxID=2867016 RepID=UPI0021A4A50A|nr:glycosyltransferase [Leisingera sp. S132]UWQ81881.1 glycosyltransferase [Leisingera sp. S132]